MRKLWVFLGFVFLSATLAFAQQSVDVVDISGVQECTPQTCGSFTPCQMLPPDNCFCFQVAEGGGLCIDNFFCSRPTCTSSDQCAEGEVCTVNTCCGPPGNCVPCQCTGRIQGDEPEGGGLTAAPRK